MAYYLCSKHTFALLLWPMCIEQSVFQSQVRLNSLALVLLKWVQSFNDCTCTYTCTVEPILSLFIVFESILQSKIDFLHLHLNMYLHFNFFNLAQFKPVCNCRTFTAVTRLVTHLHSI